MRIRAGAIAVLVALACACTTAPKSSIHAIEVPNGLDGWAVELAILAALARSEPPKDLSPGVAITDQALQAWFGSRYASIQPQPGHWFLEGREPGTVFAGFKRRSHYLRVGIRYTDAEVRFEVDQSRELGESKRRIHSAAVQWVEDLEMAIRQSLGQVSFVIRAAEPPEEPIAVPAESF